MAIGSISSLQELYGVGMLETTLATLDRAIPSQNAPSSMREKCSPRKPENAPKDKIPLDKAWF
jgi:hypothetical protein